ncbi:tumor necrosis factor receptor superfamily member 11B [Coregonus clupeaformis]|uniref:tumor necrosis factor receptor superfamily member 11B n=1 Tax=Coregonus clupeaformis TaxID=59861 RepID=UPI001BDFD668|nr:tumor necrosis factor receptor superfamily member 11B [Coregonus clupeaformis]
MMLFFMVMLVSADASMQLHAQTFKKDDPYSGRSLVCDRCPPGMYLRAPCSATQKSDCVKCPNGAYTEFWNHISKCLRCSMCAENQVVKQECSPSNNCECECKEDYYFNKKYEACIKHKECPPGYGANITGTPQQDTECVQCQPGFYSEVSSAKATCVAQSNCQAGGLRVVLKGQSWHDTLCASCDDLKTRDGAEYLHEILPTFFIQLHQTMGITKMRRLAMRLPQEGGKKPLRGTVMKLSRRGLNNFMNSWDQGAGKDQVRKLPEVLRNIGAFNMGDKLERKLKYIDQQSKLCEGLVEVAQNELK